MPAVPLTDWWFNDPWATMGVAAIGRNDEAVGDSFCSVLIGVIVSTVPVLTGVVKGSFENPFLPTWASVDVRSDALDALDASRPRPCMSFVDLAELPSSGENAIKLVLEVPL